MRKPPKERQHTTVRDWSRVKLTCVGVLLGLAWLGLWSRAGYLQIVAGPELAQLAVRQHVASEVDKGARGEIYDRSGRLLAKSVEIEGLFVRPKEIVDPDKTAAFLAKVLHMKEQRVRKKLQSSSGMVYLSWRVGDRTAARIREAALPGVHFTKEFGRFYPNGHLASQLMGFVGVGDVGLEGLEKSFDGQLSGRQAKYVVQRDASGRRFYFDSQGRELADINGHDVRLTIDAQIQFFAEEELEKAVTTNNAKAGTCLVVHVPTGEVLAMANYPFFNPNVGRGISPRIARNHAALDVFEPGSTMKPLLVAAALQERTVRPSTTFNCENGKFGLAGRVIKDTHSYGVLPVNMIVRVSSNIGAAKIGMQLGSARLHNYFEKLGFGRQSGLPISGEGKGLLRPVKAWSILDLATASFGQGVAVTPAQLAQAYLILANDGVYKPLKIVAAPDDAAAQRQPYRVFDADVARTVQQMMRDVVHEEHGTGRSAMIAGLETGGKTGTAQKAGSTGGYGNKYLGSYVSFIPAISPEYIVMVMVDEPEPSHYGGVVAAPAVREVTLRMLSYLGRMPETVQVAKAAASGAVSGSTAAAETPAAPMAPSKADKDILAIAQSKTAETKAVEIHAVPDFSGMPLRRVVEILAGKGIMPRLEGQGLVVSKQSPGPGTPWPGENKSEFVLWLARPS
ncbi:penicillin-binding transpeptidase domain-containing protein [Desulfovibrio sp. TomC]|uniref:penicillin-binding transpeptidase domain-containing protein n=1 Tax=Desulfovibrio sp. TomC TaxID=1562888 RepID=UPI000574A78F|nr:penicillin-binding transpeptidase domain-containing protein [Desulfovibrio sp. TomC]KHK03423.1 Cell division protein FtsI (Peptidoglycan synthetase) [Desulfovibrio sp. TomC]